MKNRSNYQKVYRQTHKEERKVWYEAHREDEVRRVYPAVVFKVSTAKRRGYPRYCAIPIEPTMEPWAARALVFLSKFH